MKEDFIFWGISAALIVAFLLALSIILWPILWFKCHQKWDDSGLGVRFEIFAGCQLSENDGKTWIPADRYRYIE